MRYLNRIIFINSAHIRYAEIKLDGNVHFIGTQGVGKSTLLRAILFFYNVDKSRLGIKTQAGQKGYDEFYLPNPDSYIIYEVCRENGTFFVVSFLSGGRAAFRIVDCAYDRSFFIDDDGNVLYEWGKISTRIGNVYKSNVIRSYEDFRDVIYGNQQNTPKELRRFCILEGTKYQNVPRTIQNIFLNQSLESRVIKETIIDSMDFADDNIDLTFFRDQVKDFRQQYEDIWKWYKREKNGKIKVKTDAENVISQYSMYECQRKMITELCGNLNFALQRDKNRIPELAATETELSAQLSRAKRLLNEENGKFTKERDTLKGEDAVIDNFLKTIKSKRQHYAEIGIEHIAEMNGKEGELKIRRESLENQESTLTEKNSDITSKYNTLQKETDSQLKEFELQISRQKNDIDKQLTEEIAIFQVNFQDKIEAINNNFQWRNDEIQDNINQAKEERNDLKLRRQKVSQTNPYASEMDELSKKLDEHKSLKSKRTNESAEIQREIDNITYQAEMKRKDLEIACEKEIQQIENKIEKLNVEIEKCDDLIGRQKGSLIEWLADNVGGWDNNIGKVLDEDSVLYNTTLNPRLDVNDGTVFGVKIDVENIERNIRTPEKIQSQKTELQQAILSLSNQIAGCKEQLNTDIAEQNRKPASQLKELRMRKINVDAECSQIPERIKKTQKELADFDEKLKIFRAKELEGIDLLLGKVNTALETLAAAKSALSAKFQTEKENLKKLFEKQKRELEKEAAVKKVALEQQLITQKQETTRRKNELTALMDAELKGLGVDTSQLAKIRAELQSVNADLQYIETNRAEYISWQNDTRDYFSQEQNKKGEQKQIRLKINDIQDKYNKRKEKLSGDISHLDGEVRRVQDAQKTINEAINSVETFINNSTCPSELPDVAPIETVEKLAVILNSLRDGISGKQEKYEDFKRAVTVFKTNFSAKNTFHFRTDFNADADYIEFAAELNEFLVNNKIEEYRIRTSRQYSSIIRRIAKEVSDLDEHNADIKSTINDINRDFRENMFAGVIKKIELRAEESSDRLMQQLLNIKRFNEENNLSVGELNLFSDQDTVERTNQRAVEMLMTLIDLMDLEQKRDSITLSDTFNLVFKVKENDYETKWTDKLTNVGSDGTDILVKAMVNIMLINVFKQKITRKFGDFKLHCMMDEIGKLHPDNVEGILKFANVRNIYLINSSPTTYNAQAYKYTYSLSKDSQSNTIVKQLLTIR